MDEIVAHYSEAREGSPVTYTYSVLDFRRLLKGFEVSELELVSRFMYMYMHIEGL
jgi:hypothetical protein